MARLLLVMVSACAVAACGVGPDVAERDCGDDCEPCAQPSCSPAPSGWSAPALLWYGDAVDAPECPGGAPPIYEGSADLEATFRCPACVCSAPACLLPAGLVANTSSCNIYPPGTVFAEITTPDGWDGTCVSSSAIPDDTMRALEFHATTVSGCEPVLAPEPEVPAVWQTVARGCDATAAERCGDEGAACGELSRGFQECVFRPGDELPCPAGYSERHVFHGGTDDTRHCAECTCGPPEGSNCVAWVESHFDGECSEWNWEGKAALTGSFCVESTVPFVEVHSIQARLLESEPGACAPGGGEPIGDVVPTDPTTFCCRSRAASDPPAGP